MLDLSDKNNIQYIIYALIIISIVVVLIQIRASKSKNGNKKTVMIDYDGLVDEKNKKIEKTNLTTKEIKKGLKEYDKSDFNFSSFALMLKSKQVVYNPDLFKDHTLMSIKDFFLGLQKNFNLLVKTGVYEISDEALLKIKKSIWKLDISNLLNTLHLINIESGITKDPKNNKEAEDILKQVIILTLKNGGYNLFLSQDQDELDKKLQLASSVIKKKMNGSILTSQDEDVIKTLDIEKEIFEEFSVITKGIDMKFLGFNLAKSELSVKINYKDIFSSKILKIMQFYKGKGIKLIKIFI